MYVTLDWRLVMVKKSFLLHFWQQDHGYERFYIAGSDPLALYRSVFSNQEVALLYTSFCGPQDNSDPCKGENLALSLVHVDHYIERAKEEESLLSVYRWLLVKSLISQVDVLLSEDQLSVVKPITKVVALVNRNTDKSAANPIIT